MTVIDMVAKEFHMNPKEVIKESISTYLHQKLSKVEAAPFPLDVIKGFRAFMEFVRNKVKE